MGLAGRERAIIITVMTGIDCIAALKALGELNRLRIVPKTPQLVDQRQREILVGEEPGYPQSSSLHSFSRMSRGISSGCEPA